MAQVILDGTLSKTQYEYKKNYPGQGGDIYFNTYQTYDRPTNQSGNINVGTLKTYQLVRKNNNWYIGAELGVDGKWKAVTEKESKILVPNSDPTKPGSFSPIPNATDEKVLGDIVIADLNAGGRTSLRFQAITNSKKLLKKGGGLSDFQVDDEFQTSHNITGPAATPLSPQAPSLYGTPVSPTSPTRNPSGPDPNATTLNPDVINNIQINTENPNPSFRDLVYPTKIRDNGQDFIKFTVIKYIPRKLNVISTGFGRLDNRRDASNENLRPDQEKEIKGSIILPIQPSISDNNSVDWNGTGLDPLGMTLTSVGLNLASPSLTQSDLDSLFLNAGQTLSDANVQRAFRLYLAQKAAGVSGLLSRVAGAVVNPNIELLFQGPTLRPFNFTFRLSPRDQGEAKIVRQIIRVFKQYSAVGTASGGLFLTTPNVFNIQYVSKNNENEIIENHQSLNRIKTCALKSISVDYTPDGSYMTFSDEERTMTSYNLSMQFQELEPVTTEDYKPLSDNEIGY